MVLRVASVGGACVLPIMMVECAVSSCEAGTDDAVPSIPIFVTVSSMVCEPTE